MTLSPAVGPARARTAPACDLAPIPSRLRRPRPEPAPAANERLQPRWHLVTLVTAARRPLFGHVIGGRMHLGLGGRLAVDGWLDSIRARPWLVADTFIVMPDHIHGLVARQPDAPPGPLDVGPAFAQTVEGFALGVKALIARRLRTTGLVTAKQRVWEGGMTLHLVRGHAELDALRRHVRENPLRWWRRLGYGFPAPGAVAASDRVAEGEEGWR